VDNEVSFGSGNVFRDLGFADAEERLAKADLASKIAERELTQSEAAQITGVPQPKISQLTRGRFSDFSTDRLCRMLNSLGVSVALVLTQ
jgi:predicted XRE-type DNA-binding protein